MDERGQRSRNPLASFVALSAAVALFVVSMLPVRASSQVGSELLHQYRIDVTGPSGANEPVMVTFPRLPGRKLHPDGHRWPVAGALPGLGEAQGGVERGFLGWNVDYQLPRAFEAMLSGRLTSANFQGFVRPPHLSRINAWLASGGFEGVAVITPYTPAVLDPANAEALARYGDWLAGPLLEQVRAQYPGLARTSAGTGIDGISLGGRIALEVGFRHPESFGAVGGIQPAARGDAERLTAMVRPEAGQRIRLVSSDGDSFLEATRALSERLRERRIPHDLVVTPGPHDYPFNRGPGSIELLRFGQMALRPEPATDAP